MTLLEIILCYDKSFAYTKPLEYPRNVSALYSPVIYRLYCLIFWFFYNPLSTTSLNGRATTKDGLHRMWRWAVVACLKAISFLGETEEGVGRHRSRMAEPRTEIKFWSLLCGVLMTGQLRFL